MKRLVGSTIAVAFLTACASSNASLGPPSACASDLMQGGYVTGKKAQASAEAYCGEYTAPQVSIAKDLFDKKYETRFASGLAIAAQYQPAEIACAKRELDTARADNPAATLVVQSSCQGATFAAAPEAVAATPKSNTLLDALTAEGHCSKFLAAVEKVGLTPTLKTGGPWTVFAPTNRAVNNYPGGFDALMDKPDRLKKFVRMHLVDGLHPSSEIKPTGAKWPTADGRHVIVEKKGAAVTLNKQVKVIKSDLPADNGLIYTIEAVLEP